MKKLLVVLRLLSVTLGVIGTVGCEKGQKSVVGPNTEQQARVDKKVYATSSYQAYPSGWKLPFCGTWQISCGYGCGAHQNGNSCYSQNYHAVDWNLPGDTDHGELVVAPASGWVRFSGWNGTYGVSVVVDAGGGYLYRLAHLVDESVYRVRAGTFVQQGQIIGLCGRTGVASGSHIHFSVHYPASYAGSGQICGPSKPQNGISGHSNLYQGGWYSSGQYCQSRP